MSGDDKTPEPDVSATTSALAERLRRQQQGAASAPLRAVDGDDGDDGEFGQDDDDGAELGAEADAAVGPARSIGRAGAGMATVPVYGPIGTMNAMFKFADDVYFGTRGRVKRWRIIDAVIRVGLTDGQKRRILARLAPDQIAALVPDRKR